MDNHRLKKTIVSFSIVLFLFSCQRPDVNTYRYNEVGKTSAVTFGNVLKARSIGIIGENAGAGSGVG